MAAAANDERCVLRRSDGIAASTWAKWIAARTFARACGARPFVAHGIETELACSFLGESIAYWSPANIRSWIVFQCSQPESR